MFFSKKRKQKRADLSAKRTQQVLKDAILDKALEENLEKQNKIIDLENNLDFINEILAMIRHKCKKNNTKLAKEILGLIGETENE